MQKDPYHLLMRNIGMNRHFLAGEIMIHESEYTPWVSTNTPFKPDCA